MQGKAFDKIFTAQRYSVFFTSSILNFSDLKGLRNLKQQSNLPLGFDSLPITK